MMLKVEIIGSCHLISPVVIIIWVWEKKQNNFHVFISHLERFLTVIKAWNVETSMLLRRFSKTKLKRNNEFEIFLTTAEINGYWFEQKQGGSRHLLTRQLHCWTPRQTQKGILRPQGSAKDTGRRWVRWEIKERKRIYHIRGKSPRKCFMST